MNPLLTQREMRECDRTAIEKLRIPGLVLMENAGSSAAGIIAEKMGPVEGKSIIVFCGKGNNGGDGFVISRHLLNRGARVIVALIGARGQLTGDSRINFESILHIGKRSARPGMLRILQIKSKKALHLLPAADIVIDAILGTGFAGELKGVTRDIVHWINGLPATRISVDIPSGLNADNGQVADAAVRANLTITMCMRKIGLFVAQGRSYAGSVEVANIGFEPQHYSFIHPNTFQVEEVDVRTALPPRPFDAHKHIVGKVLIIAGSKGLTGAASMTATSAMRAGAGAVILGAPEAVYSILARKLTEVMVEPLPDNGEGSLSISAHKDIEKHLDWADVLIIGPGLSRNQETQRLVRSIVAKLTKPALLDADALNAFIDHLPLLRGLKRKDLVLTPHAGELARLIGMSAADIERERVSVARNVARDLGLTLVLKGAPTVTASATGDVFVNSSGNPGMATAGSGDVLSGIIGAFRAQRMNSIEASFCGVYVHGRAGDLARGELGERGMMATDIIRHLHAVLQ